MPLLGFAAMSGSKSRYVMKYIEKDAHEVTIDQSANA